MNDEAKKYFIEECKKREAQFSVDFEEAFDTKEQVDDFFRMLDYFSEKYKDGKNKKPNVVQGEMCDRHE